LQQNLRFNQESVKEDRELVMRLAPLYQQDRALATLEGERRIITRQLTSLVGEISSELIERVQKLSTEKLEVLGEDLLKFTQVDDLESWLTNNQ
jgi:hypothetical protein